MTMDKKDTVKKLERLGKRMVEEINNDEGPTFETTLRTKSNTIYDEGIGCLRTGDKKETRKFLSMSQARTFMQTVAIAAKTKSFVEQDLHTSIRGLFYQLKFSLGENMDEELFSEQSESNNLIEDLEVAMKVKREDLNLTTDRKGFVAGPMIIEDNFGGEETVIDCTKQGRSGWSIPSDVDNGMVIKEVKAEYVLVVEKDALWQRLNEDQFWRKENCLVVTPKGQSTRGTRRLLRKLADKKLPIYCLMDCDAWGWYIYWTIKTGSMNLAYLGRDFAVPEARFLGVTMSDIEEFEFLQKLTIKTKEVDIKRAEEMMGYPWINMHKQWMDELKMVLKTKKKIEQDALQGQRLTFVGEYINKKIKNKEWLP
jgi:DNA topoisomerase-6 subunit A